MLVVIHSMWSSFNKHVCPPAFFFISAFLQALLGSYGAVSHETLWLFTCLHLDFVRNEGLYGILILSSLFGIVPTETLNCSCNLFAEFEAINSELASFPLKVSL